jgi:uncharacterized protein (TIGR03067 family)
MLAVSTAEPKDSITSEQKKFEGTWKMISATSDGMETPAEEMKKLSLIFEGDRFAYVENNRFQKYVLDVESKPYKIDLEGAKGVYRFKDEDTLEIHWRKNQRLRPTDFTAPKGTNVVVFIMKRETKK